MTLSNQKILIFFLFDNKADTRFCKCGFFSSDEISLSILVTFYFDIYFSLFLNLTIIKYLREAHFSGTGSVKKRPTVFCWARQVVRKAANNMQIFI
jgi:hypothetical protein